MAVDFGCIADDFTGATDIAGILARTGATVNLRIGVPDATDQLATDDTAAFEVIALKSRTAPVDEAIAQTTQALAWLQQQGAQRFFWKYCSTFDSTADGNIGPVSLALMKQLGTDRTLYCPAFPENGRSVYMGYLYVGQQLLNESPMQHHPLTPMRDANLARLLAPQIAAVDAAETVGNLLLSDIRQGVAAVTQRLQHYQATGVRHIIADAIEADDLSVIAEATHDWPLLTGGSAIAMYLPALYAQAGLTQHTSQSAAPEAPGAGQIVLSGSCSSMTRQQVAAYRSHATSIDVDPLVLARDESELPRLISTLQSIPPESPKLIVASADPEQVKHVQSELGVEAAGALVESALSALAAAAFDTGVRRFVVAGGETSGAVTAQLGVDRLRIGPEIAPGVPWTYTRVKGESVALALKSGNFGQPDFFHKALTQLESH